MIVICEECGKKYSIDASKVGDKGARFRCKACKNTILIQKPEAPQEAAAPSLPTPSVPPLEPESHHAPEPDLFEQMAEEPSRSEKLAKKKKRIAKKAKKTPPSKTKKEGGIGIRLKMLLLFLIIPITIIAAASFLYLTKLSGLASSLIGRSMGLVTEMSESIIAESARSAAAQCGIYLDYNPSLTPEYFDSDFAFRRLAQKKLGITGYTFLFSLGDDSSPSVIWVHPSPKVIGEPLYDVMKKDLGADFSKFKGIVSSVETGQKFESGGYFSQKDREGKLREKYIFVAPIEGTDLAVAATTYIDEFTLPVSSLEHDAQVTTEKTRNFIISILAGALIVIGLIVTLYSTSLSGKIKKLTDIANRISVGELDEEIKIKSGDEIGALAEAISRMQDSIRLSIERLRKKR